MAGFPARFTGTCNRCGKAIEVGMPISWRRRGAGAGKGNGQTWHVDCQHPWPQAPSATHPYAYPNVTAVVDETTGVTSTMNGERQMEHIPVPDVPHVPTFTHKPNGEASDAIIALATALQPLIQSDTKGKVDENQVRAIASELIKSELASITLPKVIEVKQESKETVRIESAHAQFPKLLALASTRLNTYLYGVSGGGKTTAASQVAKALSLPFYAISLNIQSTPSLLIGFKTANGDYAETDFYRWYVNGGIFLFDEYDNTSGNLQTTLNTALDNEVCSFPNGLAKRHPDAICIAAGNTVGLGANGTYSSRQVMDSAARERFVFLKWEYDFTLETALARATNSKDGEKWSLWIQLVRKYAESIGLKLLVSPRASIFGAKLLLSGEFTSSEVADLVLFKGVDSDTRSKVLASNPLPKVGA